MEEQERTVALLEGYVKKNPKDKDYANALARIGSHVKMVQGTCTTNEAATMASVSFSKEGTVDDLRLMVAILQKTEGQQSAQDAVKHFSRIKKPTSYTELSALANLSTELNDKGTALAILQPHLSKPDCPAEVTAQYDSLMKEKTTEIYHKASATVPQVLALYGIGEVIGKYTVRSLYYSVRYFMSAPTPKPGADNGPR